MKTGKHSKRRQQQQSGSGRAVLLTFYMTKPRRSGGGASTASSRNVRHHHDVHHHHHHHYHHHLHGDSHEAGRGSENCRSYDRRADLLEYSRQLRATAATTPLHLKPDLPPRRSIKTVGAVRHDGHRQPQPAGDDRKLGTRRLERARSPQQIRQRCFGGGDWNWKRVLRLVLPCHNSMESSKRSMNHRDDNDNKNNSKAKAWPAARQLVGKLKVDRRSGRPSNDDEGLVKKLFSVFRQQSRSGR